MTIERKMIAKPQNYRGHLITLHEFGPDVLARVDGEDLPNWYVDLASAASGGMRYVDQIETEKAKKK